jgi:hypothetical protein
MSERFCPRCNASVEDVGGFCLLGLGLSVAPSTGSLSELRAEVDQAFEEARIKVAVSLGEVLPPPPPPVMATTHSIASLRIQEEPQSGGSDPITEFAPAPRMDWGPERQGLLKRNR